MSDKTETVSVPRELLDRVLFSIMEQGFEADGQYELVLIQKAPAAHPLIKTLRDSGELIALKATVDRLFSVGDLVDRGPEPDSPEVQQRRRLSIGLMNRMISRNDLKEPE